MKTLKSKFILLITCLIVVVILTTSTVLITQKKKEIETDIYKNSFSYAELVSFKIAELADTHLSENNFLFFMRDFSQLFSNSADIESVQIYNFKGELLFDQTTDLTRQHQGTPRLIKDTALLKRIKSAYTSVQTNENLLYFFDKKTAENYDIITEDGTRINNLPHQPLIINNIVSTINGQYAIQYNVSYKNLHARLIIASKQISAIALSSILASILIGYFLSSIVTRPLSKLNLIVKKIATGDFDQEVAITSQDEVGQLAVSIKQMTEDLKKSTEARIYQEKVQKELEIASKIQQDILPQTLPAMNGYDFAAIIIPATEVGGDVYDFIKTDENSIFIYIGDVTGHGVPAGLISSSTNVIVTSIIDLQDPKLIVSKLNKVLKQKSAANLFITLLFVKLENSNLTYISAGHEKPLFFKKATNTTEYLKPGGLALGLFDNIDDKLNPQTLTTETEDVFILYTDGIPEAWSSDTTQYGEEKFREVCHQAILQHSTAEQIKNEIINNVKSFMADYEQKDDITLIVIKKV